MTMSHGQSTSEQKDSIWFQILSNTKTRSDLKGESHILALGYPDSGKSSLIRILQSYGSSETLTETELYMDSNGVSGIDNAYINVRRLDDEEDLKSADIEAQINLWILQSPLYKDYFKRLFKPSYLEKTLVLIFLDLSNPWNIMSQLTEWLEVADDIIEYLLSLLSLDEQDDLKNKQKDYILNYKKAVLHESSTSALSNSKGRSDTSEHLESPDESLTQNTGVPLIVTVCKSDFHSSLSTFNSVGMIDVVIAFLRNACLSRGAALIFTSTHNERLSNTILLYQYLTHRLYNFPFIVEAISDPISSYFLPSGWDTNSNLMEFVSKTPAENFFTPFEMIVSKPVTTSLINQIEQKEHIQRLLPIGEFLSKLVSENPSLSASKYEEIKDKRKVTRKPEIKNPDEIIQPSESRLKQKLSKEISSVDSEYPKTPIKKEGSSTPAFFRNLQNKMRESSKVTSEKTRREKPSVVLKESPVDKNGKNKTQRHSENNDKVDAPNGFLYNEKREG